MAHPKVFVSAPRTSIATFQTSQAKKYITICAIPESDVSPKLGELTCLFRRVRDTASTVVVIFETFEVLKAVGCSTRGSGLFLGVNCHASMVVVMIETFEVPKGISCMSWWT